MSVDFTGSLSGALCAIARVVIFIRYDCLATLTQSSPVAVFCDRCRLSDIYVCTLAQTAA